MKTDKMSSLTKMIFIFVVIDLIVFIVSLFFGFKAILNTQISFFCSLFIFVSSALSYKSRLYDEYLPKFVAFLSPLKILGYLALIGAFILLNNLNLFEAFSFLAGIFPIILGALIFAFLSKKDNFCL